MKTSIYKQHAEHTEWLEKISFYRNEVERMEKQLEDVSSKNTGAEIRKEIEHFQNQFIIQNANLIDMRRHILGDEKELQRNIRENPVASDHRKAEDHGAERITVEAFEANFNGLRTEYKNFLARVL